MEGPTKYSAHKQRGGKSFMVQRKFSKLGVPRIYRSSGTTNKHMFASINSMLTSLAKEGTPESVATLCKLSSGELLFVDAVRDWQRKGLAEFARKHARDNPLIDEPSCKEWLEGRYTSANTRKSYLANYRALIKHAKAGERMQDLPAIFARYRAWCVKNQKNFRAFDYGLAVAQAWVKSTLSEDAETYRFLGKVERFDKKPDPTTKISLTPRQMMNVVQRLPDDVGAMVWSMAIYGMHHKEYCDDGWEIHSNWVQVFGEKRTSRIRKVPLLPKWPPAPVVEADYDRLLSYVKRASRGLIATNAMRNEYSRWLLNAGIPWNRVKMYQGHKPSEQTDTYAFYNVVEELKTDGLMLQAWLERQLDNEPAPTDLSKVKTIGKPRGRHRARKRESV